MTSILLDPLASEDGTAKVYATAIAWLNTQRPVEGKYFDFQRGGVARIELDPPAPNSVWNISLEITGEAPITRSVSFTAADTSWSSLVDIDPKTLIAIPQSEAIAEWKAVLEQLREYQKDPGPKGDKGDPGIRGEKGDKGDQGIQGEKGDQGDQGIQGIQGQSVTGDKGDKGDPGIQGLKGDKGDQGIQGIQGLKGDPGIQGVKGDQGIQGIQGIQGLKGDQGIQGIQGIQGNTGPQGGTVLTAGGLSNAGASTTINSGDIWTFGKIGVVYFSILCNAGIAANGKIGQLTPFPAHALSDVCRAGNVAQPYYIDTSGFIYVATAVASGIYVEGMFTYRTV